MISRTSTSAGSAVNEVKPRHNARIATQCNEKTDNFFLLLTRTERSTLLPFRQIAPALAWASRSSQPFSNRLLARTVAKYLASRKGVTSMKLKSGGLEWRSRSGPFAFGLWRWDFGACPLPDL
jgi:hypothetical protein